MGEHARAYGAGVWTMSSTLQSIDPTFIFARFLLQEELGTKQQSVERGKLPLDPLNYVTDVDGNIRETTHNLPAMEHVCPQGVKFNVFVSGTYYRDIPRK